MIALWLLACGGAPEAVEPVAGEDAAPVAVAGPGPRVKRGEPAILDGSGSWDPDDPGAPLAFAWEVVAAPGDVVLEGADQARPELRAEGLGAYVLSLVVTDASGRSSANEALAVVEVVPWEALAVELTWDADVDLDLHLVAPGGAYYGDGDCFFGDPSPDWGEPGDGSDDPTLAAEADAGGSETIALQRPEEGVYTVLVHFWAAHGARGDVEARVTVRGEDLVLGTATGRLPAEGAVWTVGTVDWSALAFAEDGAMTTHEALGGPAYND